MATIARIKVFMVADKTHPTVSARLSMEAGTLHEGGYWVEARFGEGAVVDGHGQTLSDALRALADALDMVEIWTKVKEP